MNKIEALIQRLCPNGVEFKALGDITIWDKKFKEAPKGMQKSKVNFKHISASKLKSLQNKNGDIRGYFLRVILTHLLARI